MERVLAIGLPASPGAAQCEIAFSSDKAEILKAAGRTVAVVRMRPRRRTSTACTRLVAC